MTLFQATLATALVLLATGGHLLWHGARTEQKLKAFPRSKTAAYILMGSATIWFLYLVLQLGPSDFGQYRTQLFGIFLVTAIGSFYYAPDFLAVRGLAGLTLLIAGVLLDTAYMQVPQSRLFLVSFVYLCIVLAIILGAAPYKLRDFFDWLYRKPQRSRLLGLTIALYGVLLALTTLFY
jgi:hypothetical protein